MRLALFEKRSTLCEHFSPGNDFRCTHYMAAGFRQKLAQAESHGARVDERKAGNFVFDIQTQSVAIERKGAGMYPVAGIIA
jgi:hypothetical protein